MKSTPPSRYGPLQNRVQPTGEIISDPARGLFTGNRGIIHRPDGTLGTSRWSHKHWLVCTLTHPRGVYHGPMPPRRWTALFFLDEAVALTAGHRPCHYCRRAAYHAWCDAWGAATGAPVDRMMMDTELHRTRVTRGREQVRHTRDFADLPDFSFVLFDGRAHMLLGEKIIPFQRDRYGAPQPKPIGSATVLTPSPTVAVLAAGYKPVLHPSAGLTQG